MKQLFNVLVKEVNEDKVSVRSVTQTEDGTYLVTIVPVVRSVTDVPQKKGKPSTDLTKAGTPRKRKRRRRKTKSLPMHELGKLVMDYLPYEENLARSIKDVAGDTDRSVEGIRKAMAWLESEGLVREITGKEAFKRYVKVSPPITTPPQTTRFRVGQSTPVRG